MFVFKVLRFEAKMANGLAEDEMRVLVTWDVMSEIGAPKSVEIHTDPVNTLDSLMVSGHFKASFVSLKPLNTQNAYLTMVKR